MDDPRPSGAPQRGIVFNIERYMVYDGPGIRTVVFFKGCPLRCLWCDNPESQRPGPQLMVFREKCIGCGRCVAACPTGALAAAEDGPPTLDPARCQACGRCAAACPTEARVISGRRMTADEVVGEVMRDAAFYRRSSGGVTLGGGEPTAQPAFAAEILRQCRERGLHTAIETCGCASWEHMETVLAHTQLVYLDLKHMDRAQHRRLTGVDNDQILENARRILALAGEGRLEVILRCTCVPGYNDSPENLARVAALAAGSPVQRIELLPYHELGAPKYAVIEREYPLQGLHVDVGHLEDLCEMVRAHGLACRIL